MLESIGLKFIGNVKVSSREHPKKYLDEIHMFDRGDRHVLASIDEDTGETELVAMTFLDSNRRDLSEQRVDLGTERPLSANEIAKLTRHTTLLQVRSLLMFHSH